MLTILVLLALGSLAAWVLLEAMIRRTVVGVSLVLALFVIEVSLPEFGFLVSAGGLNVFARDLVAGSLVTASIARLLRASRMTPPQLLLMALALVVLFSLVRGVDQYSLTSAINEFRKPFHFLSAALYTSTMPVNRASLDRFGWSWIAAVIALGVLAVFRWIGYAAGASGGLWGPGGTMRVLPAAETLVIAQGFLLAALGWWHRRQRWLLVTAGGTLALVLLLQHRTVWALMLLTMGYAAAKDVRLRRGFIVLVASAALIFTGLLFTVFESNENVVGELEASATNPDTFEWRYEGWKALLRSNAPSGLVEVPLGRPMGAGWTRLIEGRAVEVSPHNYYLEAYLRLGLVGLSLFLAVMWYSWKRLRDASGGGKLLRAAVLPLLVLTQVIFYVTYSPSAAQGLLLGMVLAVGAGAAEGSGGPPHAAQAEVRYA